MGQRSLNTVITIGGSVDGSFGKLGSALLNLGSMLDSVSDKAFNFGKESVLSYRDYDDLMRETQAVGEFTTAQMEHLDAVNKTLAQTTTYTPNQIAEAEVLLGQLGLTTTQIQDMLIPSLNLAMAGNISLADSVGYLYAALKSTGEPLSYADELTDQMAVAAAKGAADVDTLGESLERLGSGAKMFKGGSREILTLLTLISDFGEDMRGAEAGTALRNFALSLFAPTGNTKEVIAMLETLGMTTEEYNAYLEEEGIVSTAAAAAIKELGLSLYDEYGNARSMLEIIPQLNNALSSMPDEVRNPILRQIFGKRGFTTASNLMAVVGSFGDMYTEIDNSEGAAERMVETMQGGLGGALRELEAASTLLQNTFGEQAAGDVGFVADLLHGIAVDITNMDTTAIAGLTGMLEVLAVAGPGMLAAGGFVRTLGLVFGSKGAAIATGALLVAGALNSARLAAEAYNEAQLQNTFGTLEFDASAVIADIEGIGAAYAAERTEVEGFKTALTEAVSAYEAVSAELAGELLSSLITQKEFTQPEIDHLASLGEQMTNHLLEGIRQSSAASMSYWEMLWGESYSETDDSSLKLIMETEKSLYDQAVQDASDMGAALREALIKAYTNDGKLSDEEYKKIRSQMDELNAAVALAEAEAHDEATYIERQKLLHRSQSMGLDTGRALFDQAHQQMLDELAYEEDMFLDSYFKLKWQSEKNGIDATEELQAAWDSFYGKRDANGDLITDGRYQKIQGEHAALSMDMFEALMAGSDSSTAWEYAKSFFEKGLITPEGVTPDLIGIIDAIPWAEMTNQARQELLSSLNEISYGDIANLLIPYKDVDGYVGELAQSMFYAYDAALRSHENFLHPPTEGFAGQFSSEQMIADGTAAGEAGQQALIDGFGNPILEGTVDEAGITSQATSAGGSGRSALFAAWGNPVLTARVIYTGIMSGSSLIGGSSKGSTSGKTTTAKFAEGGRATEASIFGEAGPEWAIPEEHTSRTAALLDAARKASGFGWGELISRTGGLNADPNHTPTQLIYSPTIYANDATDVDAKLLEDKERLERWWRERVFREEMEAF